MMPSKYWTSTGYLQSLSMACYCGLRMWQSRIAGNCQSVELADLRLIMKALPKWFGWRVEGYVETSSALCPRLVRYQDPVAILISSVADADRGSASLGSAHSTLE